MIARKEIILKSQETRCLCLLALEESALGLLQTTYESTYVKSTNEKVASMDSENTETLLLE